MSTLKGSAGGDLTTGLELDWFYKYKGGYTGDPGQRPNLAADIANEDYVPMMWTGVVGDAGPIPANYTGHIIFLNEPDSASQSNVSPEDAIDLLELARAEWSNATFVFGNVMCEDGSGVGEEWVETALDYCDQENIDYPEKWGVHLYAGDEASYELKYAEFEKIRDHIGNAPIWVTESGNTSGNYAIAELAWHRFATDSQIERIAVFPGYEVSDESWDSSFPTWSNRMIVWELPEDQITLMGEIYRDLLEDDMVHIFEEAELIWSGTHVYATDWTTEDISSLVPVNTKAAIVRFSGGAEEQGLGKYLGFGDGTQFHMLCRFQIPETDEVWDAQGIIGVYDQEIKYKVSLTSGKKVTYPYLVLVGYIT